MYIAAMRRSKGSGSIRKRNNAWEVRYLGPPDIEGKKKSEPLHTNIKVPPHPNRFISADILPTKFPTRVDIRQKR